jgi:hypothetical protein
MKAIRIRREAKRNERIREAKASGKITKRERGKITKKRREEMNRGENT